MVTVSEEGLKKQKSQLVEMLSTFRVQIHFSTCICLPLFINFLYSLNLVFLMTDLLSYI